MELHVQLYSARTGEFRSELQAEEMQGGSSGVYRHQFQAGGGSAAYVEKKLLEPIFDIYRFAELYDGSPIDTDSEKIIKPALNWFKKLPVPKRLAAEVEFIRSDGGDDVYINIIPQWDGEDNVFDIKSVTPEEIKQFPNLKSVAVFANDEALEVFKSCGIEIVR